VNFQHFSTALSSIDGDNWLLAIVAAVFTFAAVHAGVAFVRRRLNRVEEQGHTRRPAAQMAKAILGRTSNLAIFMLALLIGLALLDLPAPWDERMRHLWFIALGLQLVLYLERAVAIGAERYFQRHASDAQTPAPMAHTLIVWAVKTVLWVIFLLAMLSNLGINVTTFVASLGIGGIAVALAVQNILGDLFASLSIAVDKPFEVGDAIAVAGVSGSVEHVGLKTTRIRADSGEQIVISNTEMLKNTLRNYKRMQNRRVQFSLKVNPATPPALAARVPGALREIIERQDKVRFDRAHLKAVAQDALEFEVVYFVLNSSYLDYMDVQQAILLAAMEAIEEMGVTASSPAYHLLVERAPQSSGAGRPTARAPALNLQPRASRPA
jgi:small-conductance mechanosensitive channel